uniref:Pepsin-I3 domain-containing protein n=1 Tax=Syphacia muris TaxID=451379 RepID=A0A0N5B0M1_9BILA
MLQILFVLSAVATAASLPATQVASSHGYAAINYNNISCVIENDELFINGKSYGKLNETDKVELDRYLSESVEWTQQTTGNIAKNIEQMLGNLFESQKQFWSNIFGYGESDKTNTDLANPTTKTNQNDELKFPDPPKFCLQ